jgi:hypothetical protein
VNATTDAGGNASGTATFTTGVPGLSFVTATATSPGLTGPGVTVTTGSTSEFSRAVMARTDLNGDGVINALDLGIAKRALTQAMASAPAPTPAAAATMAGARVSGVLTAIGEAQGGTAGRRRAAEDVLN